MIKSFIFRPVREAQVRENGISFFADVKAPEIHEIGEGKDVLECYAKAREQAESRCYLIQKFPSEWRLM